jgi:hypothetical protein
MQRAEWSWHEVGSCAPTRQQWASGIEAVCSSKPNRGGQTFHEPAFLRCVGMESEMCVAGESTVGGVKVGGRTTVRVVVYVCCQG